MVVQKPWSTHWGMRYWPNVEYVSPVPPRRVRTVVFVVVCPSIRSSRRPSSVRQSSVRQSRRVSSCPVVAVVDLCPSIRSSVPSSSSIICPCVLVRPVLVTLALFVRSVVRLTKNRMRSMNNTVFEKVGSMNKLDLLRIEFRYFWCLGIVKVVPAFVIVRELGGLCSFETAQHSCIN